MNEESITPLGTSGLRALPEKIKRGLGRIFDRKSEGSAHEAPPSGAAPPVSSIVSPELRERAAASIREYAEENETLFNRASRFEEKAERLDEGDGSTSESALRTAERARAEIMAELSALRESFAASEGNEGRLAFDAELEASHPRFAAPEEV